MFTLENVQAKIAHLNLREEKHGTEDVLAADLKLDMKISNDFLSQLSPTLKQSLYAKQEVADLADEPGHMPVLRYSKLGPLSWDDSITGGTLHIHAPVSKNDMEFFADINALKLTPQEGGTVYVTFRAQFRPEPAQVGKLSALLGHEVEISIAPPEAKDEELKDAA